MSYYFTKKAKALVRAFELVEEIRSEGKTRPPDPFQYQRYVKLEELLLEITESVSEEDLERAKEEIKRVCS